MYSVPKEINIVQARDTCCVLVQTYASDFNRFRMEEVPRHLKDKYHLTTLHEELKVCVRLTPQSLCSDKHLLSVDEGSAKLVSHCMLLYCSVAHLLSVSQ